MVTRMGKIPFIHWTVYLYYSLGFKKSTTTKFGLSNFLSRSGGIDLPLLNSSGCSEMTQCPASISASSNLGKNCPTMGSASSGTYLLCVPRTNNARFSNRTSPGFLNGKSARLSRAEPRTFNGTLNFCIVSSAGRYRLPNKNCRMVRDSRAKC